MPYNIIVLIKQIVDIDLLKVDSSGAPQVQGLPLRLETLSKNAVEEAVRLKEKHGGKVTAICFGTDKSTSAMKEAYAMGVDEGYILTGYTGNNPSLTAEVISRKIKEIPHDLIILGNQSAESYTGMLQGKLSAILDEPLLSDAVKVEITEGNASVTMALENENIVAQAQMPVVISVTQEINEPRFPPVMQLMAAGKKKINIEAAQGTGKNTVEILSNTAPKSERRKVVFEDPEKGIPEVAKVIKEAIK
ncbi:electron transfer flavoprotein subunit beta/FixA family protein [Oxyplasma meridianum]|uniref:Electron transfer flavoprotein subunit beta/FixA family protein n=1 Tax=Oxyplasma meridianum TaxID=3073602 RepID=A0AAX4NHK8_9ARCH